MKTENADSQSDASASQSTMPRAAVSERHLEDTLTEVPEHLPPDINSEFFITRYLCAYTDYYEISFN